MTITVHRVAETPITITETGPADARPVLLLHGGGGPASVAAFADRIGDEDARALRVLTPVHPGFAGTPRPTGLTSIAGLARLYRDLLDELGLTGVTVVGNSIGGWIAAEMALLFPATVDRYVLVDAVGVDVPGHPIADFFSLPLPEIADYSYFEPDAFRIDPSTMSPELLGQLAANRTALGVYAADGMSDPALLSRLGQVTTPTLVVWGEADRIVDPEYGRALADAIPGAEFVLLPRTGHLPQLETPGDLAAAIWH